MSEHESAADGGAAAAARDPAAPTVAQVGLIALFVTSLVTAQVTAAKLLAIPLPLVEIPVTGAILLPGAALAYAITFLASDCYTELYGKRAAQVVVNVAFAMNFVLLALVWSTIALPGAGDQAYAPGAFEAVLGASTPIVVGSLLAYVVSQNYDVIAFDWLRERTDGAALWLRNVGSTGTSQAIDTVIFVTVAFGIVPRLIDAGIALPWAEVGALILGQYLFKLGVALADTPVVYAIVGAVRRRQAGEPVLGALAGDSR